MKALKRWVAVSSDVEKPMTLEEFTEVWKSHFAQWYRLADEVSEYRMLKEIEGKLFELVKKDWERLRICPE